MGTKTKSHRTLDERKEAKHSASLYLGLGIFFAILTGGMSSAAALAWCLGMGPVLSTALALCAAMSIFISTTFNVRSGRLAQMAED